jgi:hypothetical protein
MPLLPQFPTSIEARELILSDETSQDADSKRSAKSALLATGVAAPKAVSTTPPPTAPDRPQHNYYYYYYDGRARGRGVVAAATTVMEAAAAAMATPCHTSPLLLRGGHGATASMHPGRAPLDPAFLAQVLLRCWPTPIKHISQRSCLRLFILHPRIPRDSSRLCKPRLFNNRATKLTGIWTLVPCHT